MASSSRSCTLVAARWATPASVPRRVRQFAPASHAATAQGRSDDNSATRTIRAILSSTSVEPLT
jgi:hypothetical protein